MGVTISLGVATIPDSADGLESLVDAADRALLRAKRAGKNQIRAAPATRPGEAVQEGPRRREPRRRGAERRPEGKRP
jgi:predicted signal transduction protein with EAL and GGDEF domain